MLENHTFTFSICSKRGKIVVWKNLQVNYRITFFLKKNTNQTRIKMMMRKTVKKVVGIIFTLLLIMILYKHFDDKIYRSVHTRHQLTPHRKGNFIPQDWLLNRWDNENKATKLHQHNSLKFRSVSSPIFQESFFFICCQPRKAWPVNIFIFASSYGIAKHLNRTLIINENFLPFFKMEAKQSPVRISHDMSLCNRYTIYLERTATRFDTRLMDFSLKPRLYLHGFLQSWKYFQGAEKEIRQLFHFNDNLIRSAQHKLDILKKEFFKGKSIPNSVVFVAVDIRRQGLKKYLNEYIAPKEYFKNAIEYFYYHYNNVIFVGCTDSQEWVKKYLADVNVIPVKQLLLQMCVLSICNHTITSPGAFGWWSAWLANGTTTYYTPSQKTRRLHPNEFSASNEDHYPLNWVAISEDKNDESK